MKYIADRFFGWMTLEPVIGLMMIIASLSIFLTTYRKLQSNQQTTFWAWFRPIVESIGVAALFLGLLWAFRAILNDNSKSFRWTHGRVSQANYRSLKTIWGAPHIQRELVILHYIEKNIREEVPRPDPAAPPIYRVTKKKVLVEQNSIISAHGKALMKLNKRKKGSAYYNGFEIQFSMEYLVVNDSKSRTEARFNFPLNSRQTQFKNLRIIEDGRDLSRLLRVSNNGIRWIRNMAPGEKFKIRISYYSRGVEYFYYQIPNPREIKNFAFKIEIDKLALEDVNYPDGCLTPDKKSHKPAKGTVLEWNLDRAITSAGMGVALPRPEQPGAKTTLVLNKSPYSLMLLIVSICLTLIILGEKVNFLEISLLSAVYCLLFILMAALHDLIFGFWGSLIIGASMSLSLAYLLYRKIDSRLIRNLILSLTGFFTLIHPLAGLAPKYQEIFAGLVESALIIYFFWITLYARQKIKENVKA